MNFKMIVALAAIVLLVLFIVQNTSPVSIHFLVFDTTASLAIPILIAWLVGAFTVIPLMKFFVGRSAKKES